MLEIFKKKKTKNNPSLDDVFSTFIKNIENTNPRLKFTGSFRMNCKGGRHIFQEILTAGFTITVLKTICDVQILTF